VNPNDEVVMDVRGVEELIAAITEAPDVAVPLAEQAMERSLLAIEGRVSEYPPASEANRPRAWQGSAYNLVTRKRASLNTWYERGYGPKWVRKDGTVNGRKTSELLGRSWSREVRVDDDVIEGILGNSASYTRYVHGREQADFHARRGWMTIFEGVKQSEEDIDAAFGEAADDLITALADN
jgi:hypothetical protein